MTVRPLLPDEAQHVTAPAPLAGESGAAAFFRAVDAAGAIFRDAERAEDAYARGHGTLRDAVYDRTRADVALAVAVAAAQRTTQAVQSVLSMQI